MPTTREQLVLYASIGGKNWMVVVPRETAEDALGIESIDADTFDDWMQNNTDALTAAAARKIERLGITGHTVTLVAGDL